MVDRLAIKAIQRPEICFAKAHSLFEHRVENRAKVTGRGIDDLQNLSGSRLARQRLVALRVAGCKLVVEIGDLLLKVGQAAVGRRAHIATSSRSCSLPDHTWIVDQSTGRVVSQFTL
jgi:hypothetical protein